MQRKQASYSFIAYLFYVVFCSIENKQPNLLIKIMKINKQFTSSSSADGVGKRGELDESYT
jgi:hypothetical protein